MKKFVKIAVVLAMACLLAIPAYAEPGKAQNDKCKLVSEFDEYGYNYKLEESSSELVTDPNRPEEFLTDIFRGQSVPADFNNFTANPNIQFKYWRLQVNWKDYIACTVDENGNNVFSIPAVNLGDKAEITNEYNVVLEHGTFNVFYRIVTPPVAADKLNDPPRYEWVNDSEEAVVAYILPGKDPLSVLPPKINYSGEVGLDLVPSFGVPSIVLPLAPSTSVPLAVDTSTSTVGAPPEATLAEAPPEVTAVSATTE